MNVTTQKGKGQTANHKSQKSKSAQVFGMTIFDAVMINDGRSKKGNGDAEVIHIEERRKAGRYKCPQCGKQYATSSNLSRHKQTHRSLDSQSAKKCNTCGKAYVSMPALAMHLLTHKLTHSCDVCGKLFSRPWLLQGHLRSHTGEKVIQLALQLYQSKLIHLIASNISKFVYSHTDVHTVAKVIGVFSLYHLNLQ